MEFATPMNTTGMGNVDPTNEPLPVIDKTKKRKKRRMKSLKDFVKNKMV